MKESEKSYFKQELRRLGGAKEKPSLQPYEQTGEELMKTLSPETRKLVALHTGRPRTRKAKAGTFVRSSFILYAEQLEKLRAIAQKENLTLKEVVGQAFKRAIDSYEKKNGVVKIPKGVLSRGNAEELFSEEE